MKNFSRLAATTLVALCMMTTSAMAVPVTTSFTARVENASGPITGLVTLNFKIFDAVTAGTLQWEETHSSVSANNGLVYVDLGSVNPSTNGLDESVFTGGDMWLEITIDGATQSPRLPIGSVPYAVHAATADTLGGLAPGDVALSNHNHDASYAALNHDHNSAYAALNHNHDSAYAPLNHNHNSSYAALSHSHSASDITSGTLNNARFDAYSDLSASGRIDNNSSTDILLRTHGDSRYATSSHSHASSLSCQIVSDSRTANGPGAITFTGLSCPAGTTRTGGGCRVWGGLGNAHIYINRPSGSGWQCYGYNTAQTTSELDSYMICCGI